MPYDFDVAHHTGVKQHAVDILLWLRAERNDEYIIDDDIPYKAVDLRTQLWFIEDTDNTPDRPSSYK